MTKIIISDTSCLIALDRIQSLYILKNTFKNIYTTTEVQEEFGGHLPSWISIMKVSNIEIQKELEKIIDKGEASAIALSLETSNCILIIDEKKGRKVAKNYNIKILGTLKVLLLAKQKKVINSVSNIIKALQENGFHISADILSSILSEAGESEAGESNNKLSNLT